MSTENNLDHRLAHCVADLEAEGFLIAMDRDGDSYFIKMPEGPTPDFDAQMRWNLALRDVALRDRAIPWLRQHRPYARWRQVEPSTR